MTAGILLGPSLFGLVAPQAFLFVFAPASLDALRLFAARSGCAFSCLQSAWNWTYRSSGDSAHRFLVIGHSSILIPYLFGVVLALFLYSNYAPVGCLFYAVRTSLSGISMSITAFPDARPHFAGSKTFPFEIRPNCDALRRNRET